MSVRTPERRAGLSGRLVATGLAFLLGGALVAGPATGASAQPSQVPDTGARPTPAGEVSLPDGSAVRLPPDPLLGPLAADIVALEGEIAEVTAELRALETQLAEARRVREAAEERLVAAEEELAAAEQAFRELVERSYRESAAVPEEWTGLPLRELLVPGSPPVGGGEGVARRLARARYAATTADMAYQITVGAEHSLHQRVLEAEAELADLQRRLERLRDRNAQLLAEQEAAEQRRAAAGEFPLDDTVDGRQAHPLALEAVRFALAQLGKPYRWGAEGPAAYDCSGLVWAAYRSVGVTLPRVANDQYWGTRARPVARHALLPGDLIFFSTSSRWQDIHHVAMYIGDGRMVHAPNRNEVVKVVPVPWARIFAATRVFDPVPVTPSPSPSPSPTPTPDVVVPDLTGLHALAAVNRLVDLGLEPALRLVEVDGVMPGTVVGLDPTPGTKVPVGTTVTVRAAAVRVPDVTGLPLVEAVALLQDAMLPVAVVPDGPEACPLAPEDAVDSDPVDADEVVDPEAGTVACQWPAPGTLHAGLVLLAVQPESADGGDDGDGDDGDTGGGDEGTGEDGDGGDEGTGEDGDGGDEGTGDDARDGGDDPTAVGVTGLVAAPQPRILLLTPGEPVQIA